MEGLMMDFPLTLTHLLRRAEAFFGEGEIVTRLPDKSFHRTTHGEALRRARQLAAALKKAGLERGDRVATLCWNHHQHHEAYFGVPCGGFVLHTLNLRLHPNDLGYIAKHAGDRAVIVDRALVPLLEQFRDETDIEHVWVVEDSYEELLATADPDEWEDPELDEREAAAMCYTSGTTGRPRGVVYSHRSSVLHALGVGSNNPLGLGFGLDDAVMPVVPMFHANAWGYPYLATMQGAKLVYPGPHLDPESLLDNMEQERVSWDGQNLGAAETVDPPQASQQAQGLAAGGLPAVAEIAWQVAETGADRDALAMTVETEYPGSAITRMQQVEQGSDRGRLARAIGAEEAEDLGSVNREAHVLDPARATVELGQPFGLDHRPRTSACADRD